MTPSQLKCKVEEAKHDSYFFDRDTMKFFGDSMSNYGVRDGGMRETLSSVQVPVWELWRKRAVKHGLKDSAWFHKETFEQVFLKDK